MFFNDIRRLFDGVLYSRYLDCGHDSGDLAVAVDNEYAFVAEVDSDV